jgi:BED zinc finger
MHAAFDNPAEGEYVCKICTRQVKAKRSTSNLIAHLKTAEVMHGNIVDVLETYARKGLLGKAAMAHWEAKRKKLQKRQKMGWFNWDSRR